MWNITKLLKKTVNWPDRPAYEVEMLNEDNTKFVGNVLKSEGDLWLYMKSTVKNNLTEYEYNKLCNLIEFYGDERYESGNLDCEENYA